MSDEVFREPSATLPVVTATQAPAAPAALGTTRRFDGGIVMQADPANGGPVYVGDSAVVVTTGIALQPGAALTIDVQDPATLYVCAGAAGYKVRVLGIGPKPQVA